MQGGGNRLAVGLQGLHSYFNFFFFSGTTIATGSSRMGSMGSSSTAIEINSLQFQFFFQVNEITPVKSQGLKERKQVYRVPRD